MSVLNILIPPPPSGVHVVTWAAKLFSGEFHPGLTPAPSRKVNPYLICLVVSLWMAPREAS